MNTRWPALLTGKAAGEFLGINEHSLRQLVHEGLLTRVQVPTLTGPRATRFRRTDLEKFVASLPSGEGEQPEQLNQSVVASEERRVS